MNKDTIDIIVIYLIMGLTVVATLALAFALGAWFFNAIMASDMPDWLKYILLK